MLSTFTHQYPSFAVHWERGLVHHLGGLLEQIGVHRALLVCGPSMSASALTEPTMAGGGGRIVSKFDGVSPHLPMRVVDEAAEAYRSGDHDAMVALGGSSTIDAVRAIALCLMTGQPIAAHFGPGRGPSYFHDGPRDNVGLVAIPTTFSSSEVTYGAAVTNEGDGRKYVVAGHSLYVDHVVMDPLAFASTPKPILISTGLCAMNHGLERIVSPAYQPLAGITLRAALETLIPALSELAGEARTLSSEALEACMTGAHLSTSMNIMSGATHAIAHVLGAYLRVPHGQVHGVMMPFVPHFVDGSDSDALARLLACCRTLDPSGPEPSSTRECHDALRAYVASLGMPTRLRQLGIAAETLPIIAEAACLDISAAHSAGGMRGVDSVTAVLQEAW